MSIAVLQDKIRARKTPLALVLSPEADKLNPKITKNFTDLYGPGDMSEAEALRFAMEQEAEGIRAKGIAEAEAIEKKAEAQRKMGEASILEMYLSALPEVVRNAAAPLAQTDKIVMYGDGNSTRLVRDVMTSADQIVDGMRESTGIDLKSILSGVVAGSVVGGNRTPSITIQTSAPAASQPETESEPAENIDSPEEEGQPV